MAIEFQTTLLLISKTPGLINTACVVQNIYTNDTITVLLPNEDAKMLTVGQSFVCQVKQ